MKLATTYFVLAVTASALAFAPRQLVGGPGGYWCREECVTNADCDPSKYQVCSGTGCGHVCVTPLRKRQLIHCGPVCAIWCECGNVRDAHGCPTCSCNPCSTALPAK